MSDLQEFVLGFFRANGGLVEPPRYGAYEVLLPDALAAELEVPALQDVVFDDAEPEGGDGRLHLAQGHPLLERMVERARRAPAPARAYINAVRLDKRGLVNVARQSLSFANARLAELPKQSEAAFLSHYLVFTFKVTLTTDEKHEQLATVAMDAQAGWPVDWQAICSEAALEEEPAFAHLEPAAPRWLDEAQPLSTHALAELLGRAEQAALARVAQPIDSLGRRAERNLELDRARLEQYYDDMVRDLERRLARADGDRKPALQDKIAAAQAERQTKLADAEARYRLRVDLELITAQVVAQPKLVLAVQIENRNTSIQRRIVWDPVLHCVEPLACDVCGRPGYSLQLCSSGHLAHAECLLEQQCTDCKRIYCRLCGEEMTSCAVCGRPVCRTSLNGCAICKRGTCREHVGLCHAANGAPATIQPAAAPAPKQANKAAAPAPAKAVPRHDKRPPRPPAPIKPKTPASTANWRLEVEIEWDEPLVTAYVRAGRKRTPAVRSWRLTPQGIGVLCECDKADCRANHQLLRPADADGIEDQMRDKIEELRQEYGVPARAVSYTLFIRGAPAPEPRLTLRGAWKDARVLAQACAGFDAIWAEQHGFPLPHEERRAAPAEPERRPMEPHERAEAERFMKVAFGLLKREGALKDDELYARVHAMLQPGAWCNAETVGALLRRNAKSFKVLASGLVAIHEVSNVQALAARKRAHRLPPHPWTAEELQGIAEREQPLTEREARIEAELHQLTGIDVDVRVIQREFRRETPSAAIVSSLERRYGVADHAKLERARELLEELSAHTPRWELGGWTPAEVETMLAAAPARSRS